MTTITRVLVANRGEIARRVFATCRRLDIGTVAVFSDADADAPHAREADIAVRLAGVRPTDTYLDGDRIIDAARRAGADAVHPGYGFLAENADFAQAVQDAGLTWIGPNPNAIRVMGSKVESKRLMAEAGVPVLDRLAPQDITAAHLPILIKASAGGGGRGMRIVRTLEELDEAIRSASREAGSAFGDDTVFAERYLPTGHHIEVQVMADADGRVWALGERECSLQRRHQKVIEEAPAPLVERLGAGLRDRLFTAARDAAAAVDYRGAGTVEFLADERGGFWFLEMNTRLQVEHPVTEATTGVDLVELQLHVAQGGRLDGPEPSTSGHSIEARLYAEDPASGWTPTSGTVVQFDVPDVAARFAVQPPGQIRLDSGVERGNHVGVHYDPMLAKVISRADTREAAARSLAATLRRTRIHGFVTNRDVLVASLLHPQFLAGTADTSFYDQHDPAELVAGFGLDPQLAATVAAGCAIAAERGLGGVAARFPAGFRLLPAPPQVRRMQVGADQIEVRYRFESDGSLVIESPIQARVTRYTTESVTLEQDGLVRHFGVARYAGEPVSVAVDCPVGSATVTELPRFADPAAQVVAGALVAPMPGSVIRTGVQIGDRVARGQPLLWLEAMKMEHVVTAADDGIVAELTVGVGSQVEKGAVLAVVTPEVGDE